MMTQPKFDANRANAQHSTGPQTPEGKAAVSQNATKHGMTARKLTLAPEELAELETLTESFREAYEPQTAAESALLRRMVEYFWRGKRALAVERALFNQCACELAAERDDLTYDDAMALMFADPRYEPRLRLFMRYHSQIDRSYRKALKELEDLIEARLAREEQASLEQAAVELARAAAARKSAPKPSNGFVSHPASNPAPTPQNPPPQPSAMPASPPPV